MLYLKSQHSCNSLRTSTLCNVLLKYSLSIRLQSHLPPFQDDGGYSRSLQVLKCFALLPHHAQRLTSMPFNDRTARVHANGSNTQRSPKCRIQTYPHPIEFSSLQDRIECVLVYTLLRILPHGGLPTHELESQGQVICFFRCADHTVGRELRKQEKQGFVGQSTAHVVDSISSAVTVFLRSSDRLRLLDALLPS